MKQQQSISRKIILQSVGQSLKKLTFQAQYHNPVMLVTFIGAIVTTLILSNKIINMQNFLFELQISLWLWATVLFANFAESLAEGQSKAQAESLKKGRVEIIAKKQTANGSIQEIHSDELQIGDIVVCDTNDLIPLDGEVIEGIASVDESAITGESAPVIRESGGDRSAVTGGTRVISDRILIRMTVEPGKSFIDRMIHLIEGAKRQKTPNEIALNIVLTGLTLIFLFTVISLKFFADFAQNPLSLIMLIALLVCLIPTTIGGLLSAIGIAGIDQLIRKNIIAKSGRAIEAAGDVDVMMLDKTGTITMGNRMATAFIPAPGISEKTLAEIVQASSLSDETPEGRSIVVFAKSKFNLRNLPENPGKPVFIQFTAQTQMSGVDFIDNTDKICVSIRKGAVEAIIKYAAQFNEPFPKELEQAHQEIAKSGGTPLAVTQNGKIIGLIHLKDMVKGGIKDRFAQMRKMGIKTIMITGDNPLTAAAIAEEAGVDEFIAEATPESKLAKIRTEQQAGHLVAMTGDGTNDAPALAQADVGVSMNTGTQAAREAGNMVDLDSNPTKLIEIVETGKQMLMTRGALTTFSIANDVAKYFAILPALFPAVGVLNIMQLTSPKSAILSAVIFNALIIVALVPLALKGVKYRPESAASLVRRNLLIYGFGGLIAPFIGIKLIDMIIHLI